MARILPLPPDAISQILSSKHITSLQGVVLSLLENSLDADSSRVEISLDFSRGTCTVEDNGVGISSSEFSEDGGLGKLYHTSKRNLSLDGKLHGSTGTYLASLAALSLLRITSRHAEETRHASLTMHQGKVIDRQNPSLSPDTISLLDGHGTQVHVRDLFGNMPVRVKRRALAVDVDGEDCKAWHELRRGVVGLLLAWPSPCSVRLRDTHAKSRALNLSSMHPSVSSALTEKSLTALAGKQTKFELKDTLPMLFQAGLTPAESRSRLVPLSASTPKLTVRGSICLDPAPTKQCQFISLGIHPCSASSGFGDMYDAINKLFYNSSFGAADADSDVDEGEKDRRKRDRRYKSDGYTLKKLQGRKGVDRWPILVLQVEFAEATARSANPDALGDGNLKTVTDLLEATVTQWLQANHFRPRKRRRRKNESQQGPASASQSDQCSSAFTSPQPASRAISLLTPKHERTSRQSASTSKRLKFVDIAGKVQSMPTDQSALIQGRSGYFDSWSRIKSGRHAFYHDLRDGSKPATAPAGQLGTLPSVTNPPTTSVFNLPVLEAGELNSTKDPTHEAREEHSTFSLTGVRAKGPVEVHTGSSDDFGVVDEAGLLDLDEVSKPIKDAAGVENEAECSGMVISGMEDEATNDPLLRWTDPTTKQRFRVNSRTGVVLPIGAKPNGPGEQDQSDVASPMRRSAGINTSFSSAGRSLSLVERTKSAPIRRDDAWLPGFLRYWGNPVFAHQQHEPLLVASMEGPGIEASEMANRRCTHDSRTAAFVGVGVSGSTKVSKDSLKDAKVIRQVDQKFILCKTRIDGEASEDELLLLIDQHAASERVILESLFAELCTPKLHDISSVRAQVITVLLEKPLRFQLSATEHQLFSRHTQHFADWGILYDLSVKNNVMRASQVRAPTIEHMIIVRSLPSVIAERCVLVPQLLIELLRSEAWGSAEYGHMSKSRHEDGDGIWTGQNDGPPWLKRIGSCPKGILDMLSSRACRSAIMFNDELSIAQCEELIVRLRDCTFPFLCAHGRVSLVPLVEIGHSGEALGNFTFVDLPEQERSFASAFADWRTPLDNKQDHDIIC